MWLARVPVGPAAELLEKIEVSVKQALHQFLLEEYSMGEEYSLGRPEQGVSPVT